jgi:ribosomal protein S12 methylthiotransferase accessory factor
VNRLHTSLRIVSAETTLGHARAWAARTGIGAVHDITHLDCLGLPVFIAERPGAPANRFSFGKGRVAVEAQVGAYMEAIESHFAEPGNSAVETRWGTPRDLPPLSADPVADFAPILDRRAAVDAPLLLARAQDVRTGAEAWVPAELVFNPAPDGIEMLYGAASNGLASGNSVTEASLHALLELIERDIWSIEFVRNRSALVTALPDDVQRVAGTAAANGLNLVIRAVPNDYDLPFFVAFLFDPANPSRRVFNGGWGCHLAREVALMRAVTEAAQSRAGFLHGARPLPAWDDERPEADAIREQIATVSRTTPTIRFTDIPDAPIDGPPEAQWTQTLARLRRVVDRPVYRVIYTPPEGPLHVVRLIVPHLEHFTPTTMRVGPRLQAELETHAAATESAAE